CMLAALFYAATIKATDRLAKKDDATVLGVLQEGVIGVLGAVSAFIFEQPTLAGAVTWGTATWAAVAFLAVVCTVFGFTLQPVAQKYTTSEKAGLYCAINPLIAAVLGYTFLQEAFTRNSILGAALIIGSIVVSALLDQREAERETRRLAGSGCGV
ncbi:MAG: DMT family transporter, partial [Firmicutes bacterium]|nr:DMT family transporter [Bacillota bacterium]